MQTRPEQPPEGKLIAAATEHLSLSIREAARRAGISYGRWRQITMGYQNISPGVYGAVRAPAKTLAKMARTVGITPEQMETEGQRPDAAEAMRAAAPAEPPIGDAGFARAMGVDPDDPNDPFLRPIRQEIADATMRYGAGATGSQIFHGRPESHLEAAIWDDPGTERKRKEVIIAVLRADRASLRAADGSRHRPAAGLTHRLTLAGR